MSRSFRIGFACFLGGFLGSFVGLQVSPAFWWIGLIVGFATGYLSYEWRAVLRAIPKAGAAAWGAIPAREKRGDIAKDFTFGMLVCAYVCFLILVATDRRPVGQLLPVFVPAWIMGGTFYGGICVLAGQGGWHPWWLWRYLVPPILLFYYLPKWLWMGHKKLWEALPDYLMGIIAIGGAILVLAIFVRDFLKFLFREIHSDIRLLCGTDAALGAAVGYFAGNPVIGGLAGAALGVLNYEIISVRVLKVAPRRA